MAEPSILQESYPWTLRPLIACAPMRLISLAPLAVAVSRAGGLGFLAAGTDCSSLEHNLAEATSLLKQSSFHTLSTSSAASEQLPLPIGVGFINWGADLNQALSSIQKYVPAAVWFFAPNNLSDLIPWTARIREVTQGRTKVWIQIGTVADAVEVASSCKPDVIVVQGSDAGGHGLRKNAGIISLLPEVADALKDQGLGSIPLVAAGGVVEGRGVAACLALGACGVAMGTRFLTTREATIARGYQDEIIRASDGGISTVRSTVYDRIRGTKGWPEHFDGRGVINQTFVDAQNGMDFEENQRLYNEETEKGNEGWGSQARMTTYAGTGVGLVKQIHDATDVIRDTLLEAQRISKKLESKL
ncbi:MAG: hypothetical protein M1812_004647 [Candelaria pacifica]|nr:MAG: hypothetical protein M1812_004647 [Candelaria pacifica]